MASSTFSFPPKRGSSSGATRGRGGGRPAPQRTNSAGSRSAPYSRPPPPPATAADGKWQHDLFGEKSDLYRPSINSAALLARAGVDTTTSASLRPFGTATPAAQPILHAPSSGPQLGAVNTRAMGIKGQNAAQQQRQAEIAARKERAEAARQRKLLEDQRQKTLAIAQHEQQGFVVQVEGLVSGTSAEDVQAAFGAYGEIVYCFVPDPDAADLVARLTFSRHADAADACSKLDGAIADGRPLSVKQVDRTPVPPALPPLAPPKLQPSTLPFPATSAAAAAAASSGPFAGVPTGPRSQRRQPAPAPTPAPQQAHTAIPAAAPSKMYADQVEEAQHEALGGGESMDVDMAPAPGAVSAPAAGRGAGARGGRGGRAGGGHAAHQQQQQQQAALSLAARLSGAGQQKGQQRQQQQSKGATRQPAGLAARLGAPASAQGKAGRGGAQSGGSLLSRLA